MTPHLHPRSRLTSSLFGTTLVVSFLVVAMPHIVPCPAPRVQFADSELETLENGQVKRRRTRPIRTKGVSQDEESVLGAQTAVSVEEEVAMRKAAHECPVPKPHGIIGKLLGFKSPEAEQVQSNKGEDTPTIEIRRRG